MSKLYKETHQHRMYWIHQKRSRLHRARLVVCLDLHKMNIKLRIVALILILMPLFLPESIIRFTVFP